MADFDNLPSNPDILACTQEEVVMLIAALASGLDRKDLNPKFFDFTYADVNGILVRATFTGRAYSKTGERGKWDGSKTIELTRAKLNRGVNPIELVVGFRNGMTMEHVLRALLVTYSFEVSAAELLMRDPATLAYQPFNMALRPTAGVIHLKFAANQARIVPEGSEFSIRLDNTGRADINDYIHAIKAGSVLGGL